MCKLEPKAVPILHIFIQVQSHVGSKYKGNKSIREELYLWYLLAVFVMSAAISLPTFQKSLVSTQDALTPGPWILGFRQKN